MRDEHLTGEDGGARWAAIPLGDEDAWRQALLDLPHAVAHTWGFRAAIARSHPEPTWLLLCQGRDGRYICPIAARGEPDEVDLFTPFGFAGPVGGGDVRILEAGLRGLAARLGAVAGYVSLHPVLAPPELGADTSAHRANTSFLLDLRTGREALSRRMSERYRRYLRARNADMADVVEGAVAADALAALYPAFMARRGAAAVYGLTEATLRALCALDSSLVLAYPRSSPTTALLAAHTTAGAETLLAASAEEARRDGPLLVWSAALRYVDLGLPWLHLGGGVREGDGVAEAKRRLGGEARPILALHDIYDRSRYDELCRLASIDPGTPARYFPPYRDPSRTSA